MLLAAVLAVAPVSVRLTPVWASRVQSEITDVAIEENRAAFGTYESFGLIDLATGKRVWAASAGKDALGTRIAIGGRQVVVSIGMGPLTFRDAGTGKPLGTMTRKGYASPVAIDGATVYTELQVGTLAAIDLAARKTKWTYDLGREGDAAILSFPPRRAGNDLLVGTRKGRLALLDIATGKPRWATEFGDNAVSGVAWDYERIYAATARGWIAALGRNTGSVVWTHDVGNGVIGHPLFADGRLVVTSVGGYVVSIAGLNGRMLWRTVVSPRQDFALTQAMPDDNGYALMQRNRLVSLSDVGDIRWEAIFENTASARPPVKIGRDFLLFESHAMFRARLQ